MKTEIVEAGQRNGKKMATAQVAEENEETYKNAVQAV